MKQAFFAWCMLCSILASGAGAMDTPPPVYFFKSFEPEISLWMGATLSEQSGPAPTAAYEYVHDSMTAGGTVMALVGPFYSFAEGELKNENDFMGDARFAFTDLFFARWITRRLYHNLENISLQDEDPTLPVPGIDIRDSARIYDLKIDINQLSLRFHPIDFPFYIHADGYRLDRKGDKQQRFLGGSGFFNDLQRTSVRRQINDKTVEIDTGFNVHLGPVELDFTHQDLDYSPGGDEFFLYPFASAGVRDAGTYELSRIPAVSGFSNTLRCHSNYGGRVYAGTTMGWLHRENEFSRVEVDYTIFQGDLLWMPVTRLRMITQCRWQKTDTNQPDSAHGEPAANDSETAQLSTKIRYRLMRKTTVTAEFEVEELSRSARFAADRGLADSVDTTEFKLGIDTRPHRTLQVKAQYTHAQTDEQTRHLALGLSPDRSDEGKLSLTWTPVARLSGQLSLSAAKEEKDDLQMLDEAGEPLTDDLDRDALARKVFASISWAVHENLRVTPSYVYLKNRIEQDLAYNAWPPAEPLIDRQVRSTDTAHHYAVSVNFMPGKHLDMETRCSFTESSGTYSPRLYEAVSPVSSTSLSAMDIEQWTVESRVSCELSRGMSVQGSFVYSDYKERTPQETETGDYHRFEVALTRKW